jgi:FKBP-type peptidyl-prolyl cis-trans isomerase FkpA
MIRSSILSVLGLTTAVAFVACNGTATDTEQGGAAPSTQIAVETDDLALVQAGLQDAVLGNELKADPAAMRSQVQALMKTRQEAAAAEEKERAKAYAETAAAEEGAVKTESGLIYKELTAGTGDAPTEESRVKVHYRGTLTDGTEFDSSYKRNTPATFPLRGVIKCWTEGLQKMKVGGKAKLVCPSDIAYGDAGRPPTIPPGATLVFEVELLEIVK